MVASGDSRALPLTAVNIAALVLALTVTALRCFVRIRLLKAFGSDDWLMVAAAVCPSTETIILLFTIELWCVVLTCDCM
jgi:hypothetical protein